MIVADIGNSRIKAAVLEADGRPGPMRAAEVDRPDLWSGLLPNDLPPAERDRWAIATVDPRAADALARFLEERGAEVVRWFRSAEDVPQPHDLDQPARTGADRALAVLAARSLIPESRAGHVVLCGTAITVERVDAEGIWRGGAIAAGMDTVARALHVRTAQLPEIDTAFSERVPAAEGRSTLPALAAGVFWGAVGTVRELLHRQAENQGNGASPPWLVWTGGDAERLAPQIAWNGPSRVVPDLVLRGMALALAERDQAP